MRKLIIQSIKLIDNCDNLEIILRLKQKSDRTKYKYLCDELLRLAGLETNYLITGSTETSLSIPGIIISEDKLNELFGILTLTREEGKGVDIHGRFKPDGIDWDYKTPQVNEIINDIKEVTGNTPNNGNFKVIFTHDIDWTTPLEIAGFTKTIKQAFGRRKEWVKFKNSFNSDLFLNTYSRILEIEKDYGIRTWNFLLSGPYGINRHSTRYDAKWKSSIKYIELILESNNYIGLHSSYKSSETNSYLYETRRLEKYIGSPIIAHRSHYLRFNPVNLFSHLEKAGIKYDFTVGYPDLIGFRAGVASPYHPYDFINTSASNILEIPLVYMERAFHLKNEFQIMEEITEVMEKVKMFNGCVSVLFHPENFAIEDKWFKYYEKFIKCILDIGADMSGVLPQT